MAMASEHGLLISSIAARPNMVTVSISTKVQLVLLFDMLTGGSESEGTDAISPRDGIESKTVIVTIVGVCRRDNVQSSTVFKK